MFQRNCNSPLSTINISILFSFIITLLFYNRIFTNISALNIFSLILALISILILTIFCLSENGLTRNIIYNHCIITSISILGNIISNLISLLIHITNVSLIITVLIAFSSFFVMFNLLCLFIILISILKYN